MSQLMGKGHRCGTLFCDQMDPEACKLAGMGPRCRPRKVPARPWRLGKVAAVAYYCRISAAISAAFRPESMARQLRLTVGSMKISRTALIAFATAALLGPGAAAVFGQTETQPAEPAQPAEQQAPAGKQQPAAGKGG